MVSKEQAWDYAIGMSSLAGGELSPELLEMIEKEKRGEVTMDEINEFLDQKYHLPKRE